MNNKSKTRQNNTKTQLNLSEFIVTVTRSAYLSQLYFYIAAMNWKLKIYNKAIYNSSRISCINFTKSLQDLVY
jgi:hypothetical protein